MIPGPDGVQRQPLLAGAEGFAVASADDAKAPCELLLDIGPDVAGAPPALAAAPTNSAQQIQVAAPRLLPGAVEEHLPSSVAPASERNSARSAGSALSDMSNSCGESGGGPQQSLATASLSRDDADAVVWWRRPTVPSDDDAHVAAAAAAAAAFAADSGAARDEAAVRSLGATLDVGAAAAAAENEEVSAVTRALQQTAASWPELAVSLQPAALRLVVREELATVLQELRLLREEAQARSVANAEVDADWEERWRLRTPSKSKLAMRRRSTGDVQESAAAVAEKRAVSLLIPRSRAASCCFMSNAAAAAAAAAATVDEDLSTQAVSVSSSTVLPTPQLQQSLLSWTPAAAQGLLRRGSDGGTASKEGYRLIGDPAEETVPSARDFEDENENADSGRGSRRRNEEVKELEEAYDAEHGERLRGEEALALEQQLAEMRSHQDEVERELEDLEYLMAIRRRPLADKLDDFETRRERLLFDLEVLRHRPDLGPPPPGPQELKCVAGTGFSVLCNIVVVLNLGAMALAPRMPAEATLFQVMDHLFLTWYVVELGLKAVYYQRDLFVGKLSVVWWNWMDLGIVVSGVLDQWLLPVFKSMSSSGTEFNASGLRALRVLRLFRIMRFLKIIRAFLGSDLSWTEGIWFQSFMSGVIAFNSLVMSLELDCEWSGWIWIENAFLVIYTFELALRLKSNGCKFFSDVDNLLWNILDTVMVVGGVLDMWLIPCVHLLEGVLFGDEQASDGNDGGLGPLLSMLKIMRILRVLRLVRLLKAIKPLYRLLIGVMESFKAMQWVMVLTFLVLYACSIVFTSLVGKGLITGGKVSAGAEEFFGSTAKSLFSLFKLMNGDTAVVEPITNVAAGQLLFASFMVVANWAILAILTSVVSDHMISSSARAEEEERAKIKEENHVLRVKRLNTLFKLLDADSSGAISTEEWTQLKDDKDLFHELCDATGLEEDDLNDYFECLSVSPYENSSGASRKSSGTPTPERFLYYDSFISSLKDEGVVADKRSVLHVLSRLRDVEARIDDRLCDLAAGVRPSSVSTSPPSRRASVPLAMG
eukprot:TRINITY_DN9001_c0_g1_i1.p1 TRINITY_DN9001_c0_g1~~TRINITY_DN9001_c0_g1_i1.p1  ORF type:complete len:1051 (+),score=282.61 TRINITY_DN9001_c0_g1_i1:158-3310(+)